MKKTGGIYEREKNILFTAWMHVYSFWNSTYCNEVCYGCNNGYAFCNGRYMYYGYGSHVAARGIHKKANDAGSRRGRTEGSQFGNESFLSGSFGFTGSQAGLLYIGFGFEPEQATGSTA